MGKYTAIDDPSAYFQATLWTGDNNDDRQVTNDGNSNLKPDLVWLKDRTQAQSHALFDSTRGATERIQSNNNGAESTETATLKSFTTDGFTVGTSSTVNNGTNPDKYVAWQWKANGGTTASNSDGATTATVQANTTAGFSIITWTGTGSATTLGHGLGVAPTMLIVKNRTTGVDWAVYHKDLTDAGYVLALNTDDGQADSGTNRWNDTDPTSSVIHIGSGQQTNQDTNSMVCYAFAEKQGYSKFSSYVGNNNANGPFVYTGFKPAFILIKSTGSRNWLMYDNKRGAFNLNDEYFYVNEANAEATSSTSGYDFLSNGFKVRNTYNDGNVSGETYVYAAFAENPFVTSTGIMGTAR